MRWCCAEYKEKSHGNGIRLLGIRKKESLRRSKRNEIEIENYLLSATLDQWDEHEEVMHQCNVGKDRIYWTRREVWQFLNANAIPHCQLYDEGWTRIGCILCPMANYKQKVIDMERWPHVKRQWLETIQWFIDNKWRKVQLGSAEQAFRWWISGKSLKQFKLDEIYQLKIDWNEKDNQESPLPADGGRTEKDAR